MKLILSFLLIGLALAGSQHYEDATLKMRRAMANTLNYETGSSAPFPPFNPKDVDGWDKMSKDEQDQVKLIYSEFEKLAHLMDDWATSFDKDLDAFETTHPAVV